ncbi:Na+/H+ antiporter subunit E [Methanonatronarchaeum sp. AMET6-2]|uniref:Na+/H+ antiporter subunit E n=1 Tax=Methanonatronarchaeum sp. AMET6-2 TaxID=2933293 RepID=UPI00121E5D72|nr:Na+/H+ antiporter subunit E [Methanonatronarchaeum sp. AMET6-2]RZN61159.1 MAG: cation:proton antiporter [Methanonatronarchaeia archaeon]UOY09782.1 Na+/H+ antiporter subunit E [Methanonatronarchaeum sp. AMET6-2]
MADSNYRAAQLAVGIYSFLIYLLLTAATGDLLFWHYGDIILGILVSLIAVAASSRILDTVSGYGLLLSPVKLIMLVIYSIGPLFIRITKANFDMAYRVITGKITPGIVEIKTGLTNDVSKTILANSITLTPGTLTVDTEEDTFYVHWMNVTEEEPDTEKLTGSMSSWVRRIAE